MGSGVLSAGMEQNNADMVRVLIAPMDRLEKEGSYEIQA